MAYLKDLLLGFSLFQALPISVIYILTAAICAVVAIAAIAVVALVAVWFERKISAHMQCRLGPMYVGWHGVLQTAADGVKLFVKEDIIPATADKLLFILAPGIVFVGAMLSWVVIPLGPKMAATDLNIAVLYLLATSSVVAIGIIMAGWASHNKWSLYGSMRGAAQFLSYEIPTALFIIPPVLLAGSLRLGTIVDEQAGGFLGMGNWYVWNPFCLISFICYYVSTLAETNRIPFDLPESESELVSGFHVEYSGIRFSFFFMAEYADMFIVSALGVLLFLGGWHGPFGINHAFIYIAKVCALLFVTIWLRWTLPRLRIDQLMATCWKFLIPLGLINILGASFWMILTGKV
ncbi:MAG: NADH-quinone oxidoreductase subunit NuoH [Candidatus Omnitrophota bacterium]|jgi:NADH-quinone oxidoreductase subunit H|nr:MAG: NADH-quinone oxidoreductase subunit NuoH [Candidatus Omnitrophota bacterium]